MTRGGVRREGGLLPRRGTAGRWRARYFGCVTRTPPSTIPTAEKPVLSEERRAQRLRLLARRLRSPEGLDRDALKHIERLAGEER